MDNKTIQQKRYVKQCPYCLGIKSTIVWNPRHKRVVSKCIDCGYSGSSMFRDVEYTTARKQLLNVAKKI